MLRRAFAALLLLPFALPATAEVYRWVDKDGVVHYTDKPPTKDAKPAQLPPIQTVPGGFGLRGATGDRAGAASESAGQAGAPAAPTPTIVSPQPDQTFRGAERTVPVSVTLAQPLPAGAGLLYYLDGSAHNTHPTQSVSYTLTNVERGSHTIAVAVVGADGKELARSPPVIVHMKPPIAR